MDYNQYFSIMKIIGYILIAVIVFSCNRPECRNTNQVFSRNSPQSKTYKDELLKQLALPVNANASYWLKNYEERDGSVYLLFNVQADSLCAEADILVKHWDDKLADIKRTKGKGYAGAEFTGLKFGIETTEGSTEIVYAGLDDILD